MNSSMIFVRKSLAIVLSIALVLPGAAYGGGKSGKKNFKEGGKYAANQQWDLAAQEYALAVAAEPDNAEYRLHYARALQQASLMFLKRGDTLAEQKDFASAYNAYRQAYAYDPSNEMALVKMKRMLQVQKAAAGLGDAISYNTHTGSVLPTSNEVRVASKPRTLEIQKLVSIRDDSVKTWVARIGRQLGLNVLFDETIRDTKFSLELQDVSWARALDLVMIQTKLAYELIDRRTIFVYPENATNRQKYEKLMLKTFYIGNAKLTEVRTALTGIIGAAGAGRQIAQVEQVNALIIRATPAELQLASDIIKSIDKNKAEVVVDINIYEVSRDDSLEIGNQIATQAQSVTVYLRDKDGNVITDTDGRPVVDQTLPSAVLSNLGGIGRLAISSIAGNTFNPFLGGVGTLFGLPPTSLSLLQGRGRSRLLYSSQIHALDGQTNNTKVGRSVPVRTGTNYGYGGGALGGVQPGVGGQQGVGQSGIGGLGGLGGGGLFDNITYKDVGLVIDVTPTISNEGYVEIKMKLESTDVLAGANDLTPSFSQRSMSTTARVLDGVTSVVAGVRQDTKTDARTTIPIVGLVPILGRFFTTPKQASRENDLVITVTPHITRAPQIDPSDHLAQISGPMQGGMSRSIEDVVEQIREDEAQEKRMIAQRTGMPPVSSAPAPQTASAPAQQSNVPGTVVVNTVNSNAVPYNPAANINPNVRPINTNPQTANGVPVQEASFTQPPAAPQPQSADPAANPARPQENPGANQEKPNDGTKPEGAAGQTGAATGTAGAAGTAGAQTAKGEEAPPNFELERPSQPVAPATVNAPNWPDRVRQAAEREIAEQAELAKKEKDKPKPAITKEQMDALANAERPKTPVKPASIRPAGKVNEDAAGPEVNMTFTPEHNNPQVGKAMKFAVMASGLTQLTNATLILKFNQNRLRLQSVRPGTALGIDGDVVHQVSNGELKVTINRANNNPIPAGTSLIVLEFVPLDVGPLQVDVATDQTVLLVAPNQRAKINAIPVKLTAGR
jgi:general secretion pathway protein D